MSTQRRPTLQFPGNRNGSSAQISEVRDKLEALREAVIRAEARDERLTSLLQHLEHRIAAAEVSIETRMARLESGQRQIIWMLIGGMATVLMGAFSVIIALMTR